MKRRASRPPVRPVPLALSAALMLPVGLATAGAALAWPPPVLDAGRPAAVSPDRRPSPVASTPSRGALAAPSSQDPFAAPSSQDAFAAPSSQDPFAAPSSQDPFAAPADALPPFTFAASEVFTEIGEINGVDAPDYHGTAFWFNGYLGIVYAKGIFEGGISLFDISDPRDPVLVGQGDSLFQREGHTTGFIETEAGLLAVSPASNGLNLWDLNDPTDPHVYKNVKIQGIKPIDYDFGTWWVAAQSPYVYVAGSFNGLYIVDLSDLGRPRVVDQIVIDGGFRAGALFVVGNLLYQTNSEGKLIRVYDISDPESPQLIKEVTSTRSAYANYFSGGRIYMASESGGIEIVDLADPRNAKSLGTVSLSGGGAYLMTQEPYVHLGNSDAYYKIDVSDPARPVAVGTGRITASLPEIDMDFVSSIGNLTILSDDHNLTQYNVGSRLMPHQAQPDSDPPEVNFVSPADGSTGVLTTGRVGVTLTDQALVSSIGPQSFSLREQATGASVAGRYSIQHNIVNFAPDALLKPSTVYELVLPAGGVKDVAGNGLEAPFVSRFTTGPNVFNPPQADAGPDFVGYLGEMVVLDAGATKGGVGTIEYSWDLGDGSPPTAFSPRATFEHIYSTPAHFSVVLTARDSQGQISSDEVRVAVVARPLPVAPSWSSTITIDEENERVWVVNPDTDTVTAIDAVRMEAAAEIDVGQEPTTLALAWDGRVWVADQDSATLSVIDASGISKERTLPLPPGSRPYGVAADPEDDVVYVSLEGTGQVLAIDTVSGETLWEAEACPTARGLAVVGDSIYVTRFISPATHGEVVELDRLSGAYVRTITLAEDPGPDNDINGRGVPNYLSQVVPSPDGLRLYVPSIKQNTSRGAARDGQALTFESTNRAILSVIDRRADAEILAARLDFDNRDQASAIALTPYGDYGFVALQGSQVVMMVDLLNGQDVGSILYTGHAPQGLAVDASGQLWVQNFMSRNVSVYDVSVVGSPASQERLATIRTVGEERLSGEVLLGKRIFYNAVDPHMSRDSYISCAGCHLDGGSDRRVWDFTDRGEGFRRTKTLRGRGGVLHGPVHWTANFDEIQDFENDIRNAFEGSGFLSSSDWSSHSQTLGAAKKGLSAELDAMSAYVSSLTRADESPYRTSSGALTAAAVRGRDLFRSSTVGCATCHSGPHFTDSTLTADPAQYLLHNVGTLTASSGKRMGGTLTGLDTPSLKGLWNDAPYLHDGSAATLRDVLRTRNLADQHGRTSQLTESQLVDLEAYLLSIDARSGAPVVVELSPAAGSKRQAPKVVTVSFSSWVDPATVTASSFKVLKGGTAVTGTLKVEEDRVSFTPSAPLTAGSYTVQVSSAIKSPDGDLAVAWSGGFEVADVALVTAVTSYSGRGGTLKLESKLKRGGLVYGDEDTRLLKLPDRYAGLAYLKTANGDRGESRPALMSLELSAPAKVYVAIDPKQQELPQWLLADFVPTGDTVNTTSTLLPMPVYVGQFPAGRLYLGGLRADGGSEAQNNYFVFFEPVR